MDIQRIRLEVIQATRTFALVEASPTSDGGICVKAGLQTSVGNAYVVTVYFPNYPSQMPKVFITAPAVKAGGTGHQYTDGKICYLHPNMWNPGLHDLTFVLARTAKWLNKYEVWHQRGIWPGAEMKHNAS
jgi:hypothetical protein